MSTVDLGRARWRKSTYSNTGNNGNCVEIALCHADWRKSSYSNTGNNGDCVEVAFSGAAHAVRDSKNSDGPALVFATRAWQRFLTAV